MGEETGGVLRLACFVVELGAVQAENRCSPRPSGSSPEAPSSTQAVETRTILHEPRGVTAFSDSNAGLQCDVRTTLESRQEEARSAVPGHSFEYAVVELLQMDAQRPERAVNPELDPVAAARQ